MKKLPQSTIRWIEAGSWYGVVATIIAYGLVSWSVLPPYHILPIFLNVTGAITMLLDVWKDRNWQSVSINIIWIGIAIVTWLRIF